MKMDQKWIHILLILVFYQKMNPGASDNVVKEGEKVEIECEPADLGTIIIWFRVLDESDMRFIASFSREGIKKQTATPLPPDFSHAKIGKNILTLNSFSKARDSGTYGCASIKNSELKFGKVTRLRGEKKVEVVTGAPVAVTCAQSSPATTPTACACKNNKGETSLQIDCSLFILGPLAGGCGLLLLLLITTILYCNQIRTRRCPHHYKRKPQTTPPGKQLMNDRHV